MMQVKIDTLLKQANLTIEVAKNARVSDLMKQISQQTQIPKQCQMLISNEEILNEQDSLNNKKIRDQSSIMLLIKPPQEIPIIVRNEDGTFKKYSFEMIDLIEDLNSKIKKDFKIQDFTLCYNNQIIEVKRCFLDYPFTKSENIVDLIVQCQTVNIVFGERELAKINIKNLNTVEQLSQQIAQIKADMPVDRQQLYYGNQIMKQDQPLSTYKLDQEANIQLVYIQK